MENARDTPGGNCAVAESAFPTAPWTPPQAAPTGTTGILLDAHLLDSTSRISTRRCNPDGRQLTDQRRYAPMSVHLRRNLRSRSPESVFTFAEIATSSRRAGPGTVAGLAAARSRRPRQCACEASLPRSLCRATGLPLVPLALTARAGSSPQRVAPLVCQVRRDRDRRRSGSPPASCGCGWCCGSRRPRGWPFPRPRTLRRLFVSFSRPSRCCSVPRPSSGGLGLQFRDRSGARIVDRPPI